MTEPARSTSSPSASVSDAAFMLGKRLTSRLAELPWLRIASALIVLVAVMWALSLVHLEARVVVSLRTSQIIVTTSEDSSLDFSRFPIQQLQAEGLTALELNGQEIASIESATIPDEPAIAPNTSPALHQLSLRSGSRVVIATTQTGAVKIAVVERATRSMLVAYTGPVKLRTRAADDTTATLSHYSKGNLMLHTGGALLDLFLTPRGDASCLVCEGLPVHNIAFARSLLRSHQGQMAQQVVSSVRRGTVSFPDYERDDCTLRENDTLDLDDIRAHLRSVTVDGNELLVELDGSLSSRARAGLPDMERNIMPTLLDFVRSHRTVTKVYRTALEMIGASNLTGGK